METQRLALAPSRWLAGGSRSPHFRHLPLVLSWTILGRWGHRILRGIGLKRGPGDIITILGFLQGSDIRQKLFVGQIFQPLGNPCTHLDEGIAGFSRLRSISSVTKTVQAHLEADSV